MNRNSMGIVPMLAAGALVAAGCGSTNPPCETDVTSVEQVRSASQEAEARLEVLKAQREQLDREIATTEAQRAELEKKKAELEAAIAELQG
jgi:septal ring factor EnvC (AmiA/AmiB activator)